MSNIIIEENILLRIKKESEISFWEYHILGILSFFSKQTFDSFIITESRIIYIIKNEILINIEYKDFSKIKFNSMKDLLSFIDVENNQQIVNLKRF